MVEINVPPAPGPATPAESPDPADPGSVDTGTTETEAETEESKAVRLAKEGRTKWERAQQRINARFAELTEEKRSKDRQIEQLTSALLGRQAQTANHQPQPDPNEPPKQDQFDSYEAYLDARAEWKADQKVSSALERRDNDAREQMSRMQQQYQARAIEHDFAQRQSEFVKSFPDYEQVVLQNDDVQVPDAVLGLIPMLPDGHIAAYAIGKQPELARQLWGKNPVEQAAALARIATTFLSKSPQISNAPTPAQPVRSGSGATRKDPSEMTRDEYYAFITKSHRRARG